MNELNFNFSKNEIFLIALTACSLTGIAFVDEKYILITICALVGIFLIYLFDRYLPVIFFTLPCMGPFVLPEFQNSSIAVSRTAIYSGIFLVAICAAILRNRNFRLRIHTTQLLTILYAIFMLIAAVKGNAFRQYAFWFLWVILPLVYLFIKFDRFRPTDIEKQFRWSTLLIFLLLVFSVAISGEIQGLSGGRLELNDINSIWVGRIGGFMLLIGYYLLRKKVTVLNFLIFSFGSIIAVWSGTRAVLFFLVISIAIIWLSEMLRGSLKKVQLFLSVVFVMLLSVGMLFYLVNNSQSVQNKLSNNDSAIAHLMGRTNNAEENLNRRLEWWQAYLHVLPRTILGVGLERGPEFIHSEENQSSPHNIFIQSAVELGWLALIPLVGVVFVAFKRISRLKEGVEKEFQQVMILYATLLALTSGSIAYNFQFWIVPIGLTLVFGSGNREISSE